MKLGASMNDWLQWASLNFITTDNVSIHPIWSRYYCESQLWLNVYATWFAFIANRLIRKKLFREHLFGLNEFYSSSYRLIVRRNCYHHRFAFQIVMQLRKRSFYASRYKTISLNCLMFYSENEFSSIFWLQSIAVSFPLNFVLGQDTEIGVLKRHIMHVSQEHMSCFLTTNGVCTWKIFM